MKETVIETVIVENDKYRITRENVDKGEVIGTDFRNRQGVRCRYRLGEVAAKLEKKESMFIFLSYWHTIERANTANVVQEWMMKYFPGARLWNGKGTQVG